MTATERIRKHRAKLRAEQCSGVDVWIGAWIVEEIRQLAKKKGRETWAEVQDVLEQHLTLPYNRSWDLPSSNEGC